ncbi:hypothetical protein BS47DRAFT_1363632 [Hydnum rufescens UP504]|uniref:Uncharacterized protein n=1 Tax=Hydnum rufescens UP504 TaxID=1448309 RepID=A0A9P6DS50_9AGAM|nr:hypothetical protein BS47DRAFT_1363632 [Hydnum rufescens UP504]
MVLMTNELAPFGSNLIQCFFIGVDSKEAEEWKAVRNVAQDTGKLDNETALAQWDLGQALAHVNSTVIPLKHIFATRNVIWEMKEGEDEGEDVSNDLEPSGHQSDNEGGIGDDDT